jgi:hypothetical protein
METAILPVFKDIFPDEIPPPVTVLIKDIKT